jgi:HD-like signal output (HDOD) protein
MNQSSLSIGDMASALGGAGLTQITTNLNVALMLIGAGVVLKIVVAFLNKYNIPVSVAPLG